MTDQFLLCLRSECCFRKFSTKIRHLTKASKSKLLLLLLFFLLLFENSNELLSCRWKHCGSSEFWYPPTRLYGVFLCSRCGSRTRGQNGEGWWSSRKANRARNVLGRSPATRWVTWILSRLTDPERWVRISTSSRLLLTALISYWGVHPLLHWSAPNARVWRFNCSAVDSELFTLDRQVLYFNYCEANCHVLCVRKERSHCASASYVKIIHYYRK